MKRTNHNFFATLALGLFKGSEQYHKCITHNVHYPHGAKCPKCENDLKNLTNVTNI